MSDLPLSLPALRHSPLSFFERFNSNTNGSSSSSLSSFDTLLCARLLGAMEVLFLLLMPSSLLSESSSTGSATERFDDVGFRFESVPLPFDDDEALTESADDFADDELAVPTDDRSFLLVASIAKRSMW
jgi:hypothetical protein